MMHYSIKPRTRKYVKDVKGYGLLSIARDLSIKY